VKIISFFGRLKKILRSAIYELQESGRHREGNNKIFFVSRFKEYPITQPTLEIFLRNDKSPLIINRNLIGEYQQKPGQ